MVKVEVEVVNINMEIKMNMLIILYSFYTRLPFAAIAVRGFTAAFELPLFWMFLTELPQSFSITTLPHQQVVSLREVLDPNTGTPSD